MTLAEVAGLVAAGVVAGIIGSGGGVTSLVSYPALLAVGVPPLPANIANLVAGVAIGPGAAISSRRELTGTRGTLARLAAPTVIGTVAGSVLLLVTPPGVFVRVVPFLVLLGSVVLVLQPWLTRRSGRATGSRPLLTGAAVGVVSVYGGYFGAGSGVMLLAVLLMLADPDVPRANALKNVLIGLMAVVAAVVFVVRGPVPWSVVLPLAAGLLVGSALGPVAVRRLPPGLVRWVAALCGFGLAGYLWLRPG